VTVLQGIVRVHESPEEARFPGALVDSAGEDLVDLG
jgi:hypothetical protein